VRTVRLIQGLLDWALAWRRERTHRARVAAELPRLLIPGAIYVLGENGYWWAAAFRCPCGCRETVQLNLLPEVRPRWNVTIEADRAVSLSPSIWRRVGCCSHFILARGRVEWCVDR